MGSVSAVDQTITNTTNGGLKTAIGNVGTDETVYMENGVYSGNDNTGIIIDRSITIEGKGNNVVIDAKGVNRIFTIRTGNSVTLKNLKLINGKLTDGDGGAIYNGGRILTVIGCTFTNNQAGSGGAIYNGGGDLIISDSIFTNNQAKGEYSHGGAIAISGYETLNSPQGIYYFVINERSASISNCTFENNRAERTGGAISHHLPMGSYPGVNVYRNSTLTIIGSTFNNNHASAFNNKYTSNGYGGAIANHLPSGSTTVTLHQPYTHLHTSVNKLVIMSSNFNNNKADSIGGAIYAHDNSEIKIDKSTFKNNIITKDNTYNAISYKGTKLTRTGVTITPTDGTKVSSTSTNTNNKSNSNVISTSKKADLKIIKVTKKGNIRFVFVKNIGKVSAGKNTLGVYIGKTLIKKVTVKSIGVGKTLKVKVAIPKKFMAKKYVNKFKIFKVDIRNVVKESNKKNNSFKAK